MIFPANATYRQRLESLVRIGQNMSADQATLDELQTISSVDPDYRIRGYALWALDQLTPKPSVQNTYHVSASHPQADDANPGTSEKPWKSISKAARVLRAGDTVLVHEGEYRECVQPVCGGLSYDTMISYLAAPGEKPVVKAMDIWTPQWRSEGGDLWSAPYTPHAWDQPQEGKTPNARCEQVFVNGELFPHLSQKENSKEPNKKTLVNTLHSFWIDDTASRIWLHLSPGQEPSSCIIERSVRQQCFTPAVRGLGYIRIQGLSFIGGAAPIWTGGNWHDVNQMAIVSVEGGHHWIIEDNRMEWGNAQGLSLAIGGFAEPLKDVPFVNRPIDYSRHYEVFRTDDVPGPKGGTIARRNRVCFNGISGIVGIGEAWDLVIEENTVIGNCVKENRGTCEEAGIKIHAARNNICRRNLIKDNNAYGIWYDADCRTNRITQNIFIDNADYQLFHEISPGPMLIDNNVIIEARAQPVTTGFYTHDGNYATLINNFIAGCKLGVRIRALFHRMFFDKHTTTSDNLIYNNIIDRCRMGTISMMPEVPLCERNRSNGNLLWSGGAMVQTRVENTSDVGVRWETLPLGTALGLTGGGDKQVPLDAWACHFNQDADSIPVHPGLVFSFTDPERIRDSLVSIFRAQGLDTEGGYFAPEAFDPHAFVETNPALGKGCRLLRTLWTEPRAGIQIWQTAHGPTQVVWSGESLGSTEALREPSFIHEPIDAPSRTVRLALGDSVSVPLSSQWRVVRSGVPFQHDGTNLLLDARSITNSGEYAILVVSESGWSRIPVSIAPAYVLEDFFAESAGGKALVGRVTNYSSSTLAGKVEVELGGDKRGVSLEVASQKTAYFRVPVTCIGAAEAVVTVDLGGEPVSMKKLVSFAYAQQSDDWGATELYDMEKFPGGEFPEGAWAMVLYMGRLHAGWRARYSEAGLHVRVEVQSKFHYAARKDMEGIHTGCGIKVACKGRAGDRATVIGMALLSESNVPTFGFCKSADDKKYPIGEYPQLNASIIRGGEKTTYEVLIAWDMINLDGPPRVGSSIPFSIFLSQVDPDFNYGLQWFFGIKYDEKEGDESWMGRLWIGEPTTEITPR